MVRFTSVVCADGRFIDSRLLGSKQSDTKAPPRQVCLVVQQADFCHHIGCAKWKVLLYLTTFTQWLLKNSILVGDLVIIFCPGGVGEQKQGAWGRASLVALRLWQECDLERICSFSGSQEGQNRPLLGSLSVSQILQESSREHVLASDARLA